MGMFMAVGRGSDNPPRMIVMRSGGEGERDALDRHLAIVGKGVCFDSGGISIKPADRMEEMKMDKTGACTVIAAIATVARLAPGTPLLAVAPAVENMPGPHSTRPGRHRHRAQRQEGRHHQHRRRGPPDPGRRDDLRRAARRDPPRRRRDPDRRRRRGRSATSSPARSGRRRPSTTRSWRPADRAGERYWQLPLIDDYVPEMDSWYGDLQNSGSPEGSLVKSGLFLREFVTVPWVHLDIAGTAYFRKATPFAPRGRDRASRTRRSSSSRSPAPGPADRPARADRRRSTDGAAGLACSAPAGSSSGSRADRLATRWPEHDEEHPPGRAVDWRTAVVALVGALAFGLLPLRFGGDPLAFVIFGAWFVTLVVGLATDLDQRLLPDVLTLPVIPVALVYALSGANPLVGDEVVLADRGRAWPSRPSCTCRRSRSGPGRSGWATSSCSSGSGCWPAASRALGCGRSSRSLLAGVVLVVLLATRRIGRRTYIPFGPFFIIGALWAVLIRA